MTSDPIDRRNAGLRRISNVTKGALAGGLVLTGGLSALAAHSFSGTSTAATTQSTSTQSTTATTTPSTSSSSSSSDQTFSSPSYSIQSSRGSGRVSSGGS